MALIDLPWLEMIAGRQKAKSGIRGRRADLDEFRHGELLVREHVPDETLFQPAVIGLSSIARGSFHVRCRHGFCPSSRVAFARNEPLPPHLLGSQRELRRLQAAT